MKTFIVLLTILYIVNAKRYKYKETHLIPRNWDHRTLSYDSYNYYKHKRENRNRKEKEMHQIINLLKEISSDIKKPCRSPPPQVIYVPYPVLVSVPYYYQPGGETTGKTPAMSEQTPNKHNTNIEDTHPEFEDDHAEHWSTSSEETDLDNDDDGKSPISFNTIESQEPIIGVPPVEHGSTQAGLDSVNIEDTLEIYDDNKFSYPFQSEEPKSEVPPVENDSSQALHIGNIKDKVKIHEFKKNRENVYEETGTDDLIRPVSFDTIQSKESISEVPLVEQGRNLISLNNVNIQNTTEIDNYIYDSLISLVSDEIPNIRNTTIGTNEYEFEEDDNINWRISPEETDLDNDDGKRPISFNSIETREPIIAVPPVEHGSTQAGFNSVNLEDRLEIEDDNKFNWPVKSEEPKSKVPPVDYSSPQAERNSVNFEDKTKIYNDSLVRDVSEEIPSICNPNSSNNESEFEEDDNWSVPIEETELDNGDNKRPVSFEPIQSEEPISKVPDVEHGSTQAELNGDTKDSIEMEDLYVKSQEKATTTTETPGCNKAVLAILTCCREDAAKRKRCFDLFGCAKTYITGRACHSRITDMAYKKMLEMQPRTI